VSGPAPKRLPDAIVVGLIENGSVESTINFVDA